jgi:CRP-like cAMP-binding protein
MRDASSRSGADRDIGVAEMADDTGSSPNKVSFTLKTLRLTTILKDLPDDTIKELDESCRWAEYAANDQIIDRDDQSGEVYFVVRGAVRIVNYLSTGRQVGFANFESGSLFGELSAIDGEPRSAEVFAQQKTILAIMERRAFIDLIKSSPEVAVRLLIHLAKVIREMNEQVLDLGALSDVQRVYYELLRLAEPDPEGDGGWLVFHMPRHKDLADLVGTTPEIVAHAVSQLMKADLVKRRGGNLELLDKEKIQKLAIM